MNQLLLRLAHYPAPIRIGGFLLLLVILWLPIAIPIHFLIPDPNTVTLIVMPLLCLEFLLWIPQWGRLAYGQSQMFQRYGIQVSRPMAIEFFQGLGIGLISLFSLFVVQGGGGWITWQASPRLLQLIAEGCLAGVGVALIEELVFRGWVLDELERDYSRTVCLWASSLIFAILHFIKPLPEVIRTFPQFPGLILLGLTLVWAKWSTQGRLGLSIGLHGGLVWGFYMVNVGELVQYTNQVPEWVTGIDRNPLSGLIGLLFLSSLALGMRWRTSH